MNQTPLYKWTKTQLLAEVARLRDELRCRRPWWRFWG